MAVASTVDNPPRDERDTQVEVGVAGSHARAFTLDGGQAVYVEDGFPIEAYKLPDKVRDLDPRTNWISWHDGDQRVTIAVRSVAYVRHTEPTNIGDVEPAEYDRS